MEVLMATYGLYFFILVFFCSVVYTSYLDQLIPEIAITFIFLAGLYFLFSIPPWALLTKISLYGWIISLVSYFAIGILWSIFKFSKEYKLAIQKMRENFDKYNKGKNWRDYLDENCPKVSKYKTSICSWIAYWPFSIVGYLLVDLVTELVQNIYNLCSKVYENIADKIKTHYKNKYTD